MTLWHPDPPQGFTSEQGLVIVGRPVIPRFGSPQGIGEVVVPPVEGAWINDLGEQFIDNFGNVMVFET